MIEFLKTILITILDFLQKNFHYNNLRSGKLKKLRLCFGLGLRMYNVIINITVLQSIASKCRDKLQRFRFEKIPALLFLRKRCRRKLNLYKRKSFWHSEIFHRRTTSLCLCTVGQDNCLIDLFIKAHFTQGWI